MLKIRLKQLDAFQPAAEAAFESRVMDYLRDEHAAALVSSGSDNVPLANLDEETLLGLVKQSIQRARACGMTWESSLTAFVVLTFVVAPNFDEQPAIKRVLTDESIEPDLRIDQLWERTTEEDWEEAARSHGKDGTSTSTVDEAAIIKRLDEAWWINRDNVAREIVAELSLAEIRSLSTETRNRLQQELLSGYVSDADREANDKIIRAGVDVSSVSEG